MRTKYIKFNNKQYLCRIVTDIDGNDLIIGGLNLLDVLQPYSMDSSYEDSFANKEAEIIYDLIFYFTDDEVLELDDDALIERLKIDNPEWFE